MARVVFYLDSGGSIVCIFKGDIERLWDEAAKRIKAELGTSEQGKVLVFKEKKTMTIAELRERMHAMIGQPDETEVEITIYGKQVATADLTVVRPSAPNMSWTIDVSWPPQVP